jgi:type I restriction enzyme S subunit
MTLRRYERYKDSGVEWLGTVPAHWTVARLKFIAHVQTGVAKGKDNTGQQTIVVPYLRVANVQDGYLDLEDVATIEIPADDLPRYRLRAGDVLMNEGGDFDKLGRGHVWDGSIDPFIHQNHVFAVRPFGVSPQWLNLVTGSAYAQFYFMSRSKQSTNLASISSTDVMELPVVLPPTAEQAAIASFLDLEVTKIDTLIAEQLRLIELLNEKRQAVIAHAVTKGLNPSAPMKDSGAAWLGEVPSHWAVVRLGSVFEQVDERGDDSLPVLSVSIHDGVSDSELDDTELDRKVTRSDDRTKYKRVVAGDLVYNMMRAWQGGFGTVAVDGMVSPAYVVARPRGVLPTAFIERVLRTPNAVEEMRRHSRGVTDFRLRLYWDEFKNIVVALPPRTEAEAIDKRVTDIEAKMAEVISAAEDCIRMLQERRTALISAAVTGQIDVRDSASVESALSETHADIATGRYVVESAAAHIARVQAMAAADEHPASPPRSC